MSSLTNKDGFRILQFAGVDTRRKSLYLGKISTKSAKTIQGHIDNLLAAKLGNHAVERETSAWLGDIGGKLHAKIAKAGLATVRQVKASYELAQYCDAYMKGRTDLKPSTIKNLKQTRESLVKFFGANRDLTTITRGEAGDWHIKLKAEFSGATVAMYIKKARQFFADAIDRDIITKNPFAKLSAPSQVNSSRNRYIPAADINDVIEICPDSEWACIFALARFGGLRTPSETHELKWTDIDWRAAIMVVRSPKTEHIEGKESRKVPIVVELMVCLEAAYYSAPEGATYIVTKHRGENLRTMGEKLIERAGLTQWPRLYQNLRASCETDFASKHPLHVACEWIGNTEMVAARHYLGITADDYAKATGKALQKAQQSPTETTGHERTRNAETPQNGEVSATQALPRGVELPQEIAEELRVSARAMQKALHRLNEAAPHIRARDIAILQDAVTAARGHA